MISGRRDVFCETKSVNALKPTVSISNGQFGCVENVWKVQRALEDAGIIFIDKDEAGGVGVRLTE